MKIPLVNSFLCFLIFCLSVQAQIYDALPKTKKIADINLFLNDFKFNNADTLKVKKHLKPLLHSSEKEYKILYHVLLANSYAACFDDINVKSNYHYEVAESLSQFNSSFNTWVKFNKIEYLYFYRSISDAIPILLSTLEISNTLDDDELIQPAKMFKLSGWIFQTLEDPVESKNYLEKALKFASNLPQEKAAILNALGLYYFSQNNLALAEEYFTKTLQISLQNNNFSRYARALGSLAEVEKAKGNFTKAIELVKKDIAYSVKYNDYQNTMYANVLLAKLYLCINNKPLAKEALNNAEHIANSKSYFGSAEHTIMQLKLDLLEENNFKEELLLRRKLDSLEIIIAKTDGQKVIESLNWNIQKQKFEAKLLNANLVAQNNKYRALLALVILICLIVLIIFIIYRNKQKLKFANIKTQEEERARIAADLHDNIINKLTIIRLKSILNHDVKEIDNLLQTVIDESRNLSHKLFPPMLEESTLEDVLLQVLKNWESHFKINFTCFNPENITFNSETKKHIIRIVQELTQNTFKHANATNICVEIEVLDKNLKLIYLDNGIGFHPKLDKNGLGLKNIEIRANALKATFNFINVSNGSKFILSMPL